MSAHTVPYHSLRPIARLRGVPLIALALLTSAPACGYGVHMDKSTEGTTTGGATAVDSETSTSTGTAGDTVSEPEPNVEWPQYECDPLTPSFCAFPFPSNVFTVPDSSTETGLRVTLSEAALPESTMGIRPDPAAWSINDGFSASLPAMTHMPGVALGPEVPGEESIELSIRTDSPTIVLDAETGELVPHFTELDISTIDVSRRILMIRPVVRPRDASRYIIAIRNLKDGSGNVIEPTPVFKALRDLEESEQETVTERRALYADIFARLEAAGIERSSLQLAWDYTTNSRDNVTNRLVHIRDHALDQVGAAGPSYTFDSIEYDYAENIAVRVEGEMTVPLYIDDAGPGGRMHVDDDGVPIQQGTATYPFLALIPFSAYDAPSSPLGYGHGLLGSRTQVQSGTFRQFAQDYNYVLFAVDWVGMSEDDLGHIFEILGKGQLDDFQTVVDRGQQGILNFMLATRLMKGDFGDDPQLVYKGANPDYTDKLPQFTKDEAYYFGISQGGIFGATLMSVYTDVTRGLLGVPGQPYHLLLNRSVDFDPFLGIVEATYPDPIDLQFSIALMQMLWDRSEPSGYAAYIRENTLPNTPPHEVILRVAIGDHQVSTLGAHLMARTIGDVPNIAPVNRSIWGIEEVPSGHVGSAMIEWEYGLPPDPIGNIPPDPDLGPDPHGWPRKEPESQLSLNKFLREGVVDSFCGGPCVGEPK